MDITCFHIVSLAEIDFEEGITRLDCGHNSLTSLYGCPEGIRYLDCSNNYIESLKYLPNSVSTLVCYNNRLTSLEGLTSNVLILDCSYNFLTSLKGLNETVYDLSCENNMLVNLNDVPHGIIHLSYHNNFQLPWFAHMSTKDIKLAIHNKKRSLLGWRALKDLPSVGEWNFVNDRIVQKEYDIHSEKYNEMKKLFYSL